MFGVSETEPISCRPRVPRDDVLLCLGADLRRTREIKTLRPGFVRLRNEHSSVREVTKERNAMLRMLRPDQLIVKVQVRPTSGAYGDPR